MVKYNCTSCITCGKIGPINVKVVSTNKGNVCICINCIYTLKKYRNRVSRYSIQDYKFMEEMKEIFVPHGTIQIAGTNEELEQMVFFEYSKYDEYTHSLLWTYL